MPAYGKSELEALGRFRTALRQLDSRNSNRRGHLLFCAMCSYGLIFAAQVAKQSSKALHSYIGTAMT